MCGIIGSINCGDKETLQNATHEIIHRGPDFQNCIWFKDKNSGLGHTRLSIIDLSKNANQPMVDNDTGNYIVFNGEIYNYKKLRTQLLKKGYKFHTSSDTEVILKAYAEWGIRAVSLFNGIFAFAIYNVTTGNLFVCRDRLGVKPLYYYREGNKIVFASEIKSILHYKKYIKEPDIYSLHSPVHFQVSPNTGFKSIYKLEAGHYFTLEKGSFKIIKYWDVIPTEEEITYNEAFDQLDYLLNDSIQLQMISDVPIGALLSGGLDSSIVSVLMQKRMNRPLNTFTIKFSKKDIKRQGNVDDAYYARKVANQFGFNHNEILIEPDIVDLLPKMVWHLDEPLADPSVINTFLISEAARKTGIKVLLTGMGADEVFSGYRSHLACLKAANYQKFPKQLRFLLEAVFKKIPESNNKRNYKYIRWVKSFLRIASLSEHERAMFIKNSTLTPEIFNQYFLNACNYTESLYVQKDNLLFSKYNHISYLTKLCLVDTKLYLPDHNLTYSDKAMMAAGIEGRPPLIDHRIVEFMFKLLPVYRIHKMTQKYLLKKVSEKYLPHEIIYRSKAPFSAPMRGWLRNELRDMVNDILSYDSVKRRSIYNPEYVQKLIVNNNKGLEDNSQLIWRLMVSEIWFRKYFD